MTSQTNLFVAPVGLTLLTLVNCHQSLYYTKGMIHLYGGGQKLCTEDGVQILGPGEGSDIAYTERRSDPVYGGGGGGSEAWEGVISA